MRIFIFGDSIAQGYFDEKSGGWANRLAMHYQKQALQDLSGAWTEVFNLGVSGDTAKDVLERLVPEVEARQLGEDEICIVLAVGINDAILLGNRVQQEIYDFQKTYEQLLDDARMLSPRVIAVGLTAVDEPQTDPWIYSSSGKQWKNNRINLFEDTIKQSAGRKEVAFVPLHDEFLSLSQDAQLLADGLHPNAEGHTLIAQKVLAAIEAART